MNLAQQQQRDYFLVCELLGARPGESIRDAAQRLVNESKFGRRVLLANFLLTATPCPTDPFSPIRATADLARRKGWVR